MSFAVRPELWALFAVISLAMFQAVVLSGETVAAARRNFDATFPVFVALVLAVGQLDAWGKWSLQGAIAYAAGRYAYLVLTLVDQMPVRKYSWALSVVGLLSLWAEFLRALIVLAR